MQMACGRQVTREEDTSYSLMGILGVTYRLPTARVPAAHSSAYPRALQHEEKCHGSLQPQLQQGRKPPPIVPRFLQIPGLIGGIILMRVHV